MDALYIAAAAVVFGLMWGFVNLLDRLCSPHRRLRADGTPPAVIAPKQ